MLEDKQNIEINLAEGTATFRLTSILGAVTRTMYTGSFTVRTVLEPTRVLAQGRIKRSLLGDKPEHATDHENNLAFSLSQLQVRILKAPPWWDSDPAQEVRGGAVEENVLYAVLDLAIEAQRQYAEQIRKESKESINRIKNKIDTLEKAEGNSEEPDDGE